MQKRLMLKDKKSNPFRQVDNPPSGERDRPRLANQLGEPIPHDEASSWLSQNTRSRLRMHHCALLCCSWRRVYAKGASIPCSAMFSSNGEITPLRFRLGCRYLPPSR